MQLVRLIASTKFPIPLSRSLPLNCVPYSLLAWGVARYFDTYRRASRLLFLLVSPLFESLPANVASYVCGSSFMASKSFSSCALPAPQYFGAPGLYGSPS